MSGSRPRPSRPRALRPPLRPPLRPLRALPGLAVLAGLMALVALAGCARSGGTDARPAGAPLEVVAAENTWGSLAAQLGGDTVRVRSIVASPDADPHDYEATPADGRAVARADYVLLNGFAYDPWMERLLSASPSSRRAVLKVQDVLGLDERANPHRWYAPSDVLRVVDRITEDYARLDPAHADAYRARRADFLATGLQAYRDTAAEIRQRYANTPVGATESVAAPLAADLGLRLLTPDGFLAAITEGTDSSARDRATVADQIAQRQIRVLLFNAQNATPDVQRVVDAARAAGIPVVTITETPVPADATFQAWQTAQLRQLADALARGSGA